MKRIVKWFGLGALLAGAALYFSSCDEEVREPYGGPWKLVKTPPDVHATVKDIFFLDAETGWASAYKNLLRWNGKEWVIQKKFVHPNPKADYCIKPIWAFAEDDIWVAGGETLPGEEFHSKIWRFNGTYWEDFKHPDVGGIGYLWFNSPDDGWAMGGDYMLRWDGVKWYKTEWPGAITTSVWFNSRNDGWRTSFSSIYHWDGVTWARVAECGPFEEFASIAFNERRQGWAGLYGTWTGEPHMFYYDGYKWDYYEGEFKQDVIDIDFSGPDYGCAAGNEVFIFEDGEWLPTADPKATFWCVECVGPDDIWAGSDSGDIYHFTGFN